MVGDKRKNKQGNACLAWLSGREKRREILKETNWEGETDNLGAERKQGQDSTTGKRQVVGAL